MSKFQPSSCCFEAKFKDLEVVLCPPRFHPLCAMLQYHNIATTTTMLDSRDRVLRFESLSVTPLNAHLVILVK